jgi:4-hydroxy-tetrahydrodipicolinate reductase
MKIGILGYGRMGKEVEKQALERGHVISLIKDIDDPLAPSDNIHETKVIIDFTLREAVAQNLAAAAKLGVPIVEGTTGWNDQLEELSRLKGLTMIHSPNFSIGVYQFIKLAEYAAKLFGPVEDYDCYLHEWHHRGKADSPSGTAKKIAAVLIENIPHKKEALFRTSDQKIDPGLLHVTSTRTGRIPGTHRIGFDSAYDSITLEHAAHGQEGFAFGAVLAAEWIVGKSGLFTMDDFMRDFFK